MYEPTVTLSTGAVVLQAINDSVESLWKTGHRVSIVDGEIVIDPPLVDFDDLLIMLGWNLDDVRAILDATRTVH